MTWKKQPVDKWDSVIPIMRMETRTALLTISTAAFLSYAKCLNAEFVFDDHEAIINNKDVTSPNSTLEDLFSHDFWGTPITHLASHKSYRPITVLFFRFIYQQCGDNLNPFVYHIINLILHTIVSCLVYVIYNLIFEMRCPKSAFLCSILFAVHPVHTETVVGVVGQAELLSALFASLSFIIFHHGCVKSRSLVANIAFSFVSCLLSITGMLCKEQGITIVAVIMVYDIVVVHKLTIKKLLSLISAIFQILMNKTFNCFSKVFELPCKYSNKVNGYKSFKYCNERSEDVSTDLNPFFLILVRHMVLSLTTVAAIYCRWLLMGSSLPVFQETDNPASFEKNLILRVVNYNYIYLINIWILLCPEWLCFDWSMGCIPLIKFSATNFDCRITLLLLFWIVVCVLFYTTYKSDGITQRALLLGLSSIFILFSPASNVFFKVGFVVAERVLYLPSFGYFLLIIVGIQKLATYEQHKKILKFSIVVLILVFSIRSFQRTEDWLTERRLFESALSVCPLNAKVHYNLAKNSADRGLKKIAISHYEEAVRLHPKYDLAMNNLANIYRDEGKLDKAEKLLVRAVEIRPDFATAWMNLGIVYSSIGLWNSSEMCYLEALKHRRRYPDCFYNLGNLYLEMQRNTDALEAWKNATLLKPTHRIAWSNLIVMLDSMGRLSEALNASYVALSHLPNEPNIHFNIANVLGKLNEYEESEKYFLQAIRLNSSAASFHYNLGVLYHRWQKYCKAKFHYREANRLDSTSKAKKQLDILNRFGKINNCSKKELNRL